MNKISIIYTLIDNESTAENLAETIIKKQLAACINIINSTTSIYEWP
jgi:uncharacterized protein involved in tolerance to divalent cations